MGGNKAKIPPRMSGQTRGQGLTQAGFDRILEQFAGKVESSPRRQVAAGQRPLVKLVGECRVAGLEGPQAALGPYTCAPLPTPWLPHLPRAHPKALVETEPPESGSRVQVQSTSCHVSCSGAKEVARAPHYNTEQSNHGQRAQTGDEARLRTCWRAPFSNV
jgi:hypothetical protein